jgi:asparagine synthetase B (glutamine-hydrolysing)
VAVQGIGGEFIRGFWTTPADLNVNNLTTVKKLLRNQMLGRERPQYLERLWNPDFRKVGLNISEEHLDSLLMEFSPQDSPATLLDYVYLHERTRKFLNKAILIIRSGVDVYFPFLDHQWIEAIASIPLSERIINQIQLDLIKRLCPEIADILYEKTLLPLSAPHWKILMTKGYRVVKRKMLQRLGFIDRGFGKVPNAYYSQWSRCEMRNSLVELLYNPKAAFRAYLDWEMVETLLNQHFRGENDRESLVAALTVFEIAHKLWVNR